jgi:hypothetical protein
MKKDFPLRRRVSDLERDKACRPNPDDAETLKLLCGFVDEASAGSNGAREVVEFFQEHGGKKPSKAIDRKLKAAFDRAMQWRDERGYIPGVSPMYPCPNRLDADGNPKSCRQHPPCKDGCYAANKRNNYAAQTLNAVTQG